MFESNVTIPEMIFIAATRIALGAGIGMLISGKLSRDQRKAAGWALAAVGAVTTIPFALRVRSLRHGADEEMLPAA